MKSKRLTNLEQDVLREVGNIGAGNAMTSLSQLINKEVRMEVPSVNIISLDGMVETVGGPEKLIVTIMFKLEGEITGTIFFVLTPEEAQTMVEQISGDSNLKLLEESNRMNPMAASALEESANILTGAYLTALADLTNVQIQSTIPFLGIDMAAATLVSGIADISQETDYALVIDTKIAGVGEENTVRGHFLLLPDPASVSVLFSALGIADEA